MTAPAPTLELDQLRTLEPKHLYVFVAGPGRGEGIAVAFPGVGWMLIDGCRGVGAAAATLPLEAILSRWRRGSADRVVGMVLTHPHDDHVDGFAHLVDVEDPDWIGMAGPPDPQATLYDELMGWVGRSVPTALQLQRDQVRAAALALQAWRQRGARRVTALHQGVTLRVGAVTVSVWAPDSAHIPGLLARGWPGVRDSVNELSVVLELGFGNTRVVLGGDLPWKKAGRPLRGAGWASVIGREPGLAVHQGLKVPHHGSADALHPLLVGTPANAGAAHAPSRWVTPYSPQGLPRAGARGGLEILLANAQPVRLTALPIAAPGQVQRGSPAVLTRAQVDAEVSAWQTLVPKGPLSGATPIRPPAMTDALDPIWCTAFDATGVTVAHWRGRVALEVVS